MFLKSAKSYRLAVQMTIFQLKVKYSNYFTVQSDLRSSKSGETKVSTDRKLFDISDIMSAERFVELW